MIEGISAVTLGTHEMPRAVRFYRTLGFEVVHGGEDWSFTSFSGRNKLSRPRTQFRSTFAPGFRPIAARSGLSFQEALGERMVLR
jgi:catechol 2,3-dioxygenase-like lactoylglutathione lyase family enzyme